jgi:hypothetical protein
MRIKKYFPIGALLVTGSLFAGPITYNVMLSGPGESRRMHPRGPALL